MAGGVEIGVVVGGTDVGGTDVGGTDVGGTDVGGTETVPFPIVVVMGPLSIYTPEMYQSS